MHVLQRARRHQRQRTRRFPFKDEHLPVPPCPNQSVCRIPKPPAVAAVARAMRSITAYSNHTSASHNAAKCAALTTVGAKANGTRNTPRGPTVQCSAATSGPPIRTAAADAVAALPRNASFHGSALSTHRRRRILHGRVDRSEALPACGTPALICRLCQCTLESTAQLLRVCGAVATRESSQYRCSSERSEPIAAKAEAYTALASTS